MSLFTEIFGDQFTPLVESQAVEPAVLSELSALEDGGVEEVFYFWTNELMADECLYCKTGLCVQKVVKGRGWDSCLVIHNHLREDLS